MGFSPGVMLETEFAKGRGHSSSIEDHSCRDVAQHAAPLQRCSGGGAFAPEEVGGKADHKEADGGG